MSLVKNREDVAQLAMPGMPDPAHDRSVANCCNLVPGQQVTYLGRVYGGPRYGSRGIIRKTLQRKAVVDMGKAGTWNIPYYFLAVPQAA